MFGVWSMSFLQFSTLILLVVLLGYKYLTYHYDKWKKLGVPHLEPKLLFGNFGDTILGHAPLINLIQTLYNRYRCNRYFGVYSGRHPTLVLCDPELVHTVMVRDFAHFYDRIPNKTSFKHDHLFDHLVNLRGAEWKAIRAKLTPTFSAAKLKSMLGDINVCTSRLMENLDQQVSINNGMQAIRLNIFIDNIFTVMANR